MAPGDTFFGNWVMATRHAGSVDDRFTGDNAVEWIGQAPERPFFMYLNLQTVMFLTGFRRVSNAASRARIME